MALHVACASESTVNRLHTRVYGLLSVAASLNGCFWWEMKSRRRRTQLHPIYHSFTSFFQVRLSDQCWSMTVSCSMLCYSSYSVSRTINNCCTFISSAILFHLHESSVLWWFGIYPSVVGAAFQQFSQNIRVGCFFLARKLAGGLSTLQRRVPQAWCRITALRLDRAIFRMFQGNTPFPLFTKAFISSYETPAFARARYIDFRSMDCSPHAAQRTQTPTLYLCIY